MDTREAPTCALAPAELSGRQTSWTELTKHAVDRIVERGRVSSTYPISLIDRFRALIDAEAKCCPFLQFGVTERDGVFDVELTYPPEFQPVVDAVLS